MSPKQVLKKKLPGKVHQQENDQVRGQLGSDQESIQPVMNCLLEEFWGVNRVVKLPAGGNLERQKHVRHGEQVQIIALTG